MRKVEIYCNKCRKEITGDPVQFFNRQVARENPDQVKRIVLSPDIGAMDFCKSCAADISRLIFATSQQEETPEVPRPAPAAAREEKPAVSSGQQELDAREEQTRYKPSVQPGGQDKPARRRRIDGGKVKVLRKAGWSLKAIAEEMSCSEQDVSNLLYGR